MAADASIYILKVALFHRQSIWRRIAIRGDQTLDDLHHAIFRAFDRYESHLYAYYIGPKTGKMTLASSRRPGVRQYFHPHFVEDFPLQTGEQRGAETTTIASLRLAVGQTFLYLFDFGDEWWHFITVEKTNATPDPAAKYPAVIAQRGDSPPQYADEEEE